MPKPKSVLLDPETLLSAYAQGLFPMADDDGSIHWYSADPRGILPLRDFHVSRSLKQAVRQCRFELRINSAFEEVMRQCMQTRPVSWINPPLISAYLALHRLRFAHSVECWQDGKLVGGLYGVSLGGAFFGESMYHHVTDASKVALVHLVERLKQRGYELLDTQATTDHLQHFGCTEVPAERYLSLLRSAISKGCQFD